MNYLVLGAKVKLYNTNQELEKISTLDKLTRATEYLIKHEKKHDREIGKLERRIFELEES